MRPHVKTVSDVADTFVSAHPNAGLPNAFGGYVMKPRKKLQPLLKNLLKSRLNEVLPVVAVVLRRDHIRAIANAVAGITPRQILLKLNRRVVLSGLEPFNITKDSLFVNVGERTDCAPGSKKFLRPYS